MATIVSTRITALEALSPRYSTTILPPTVTAPWTQVSSKPTNINALTGSEAIQNALITINANGTLSGAGSGATTLNGLGAGGMATINQITAANAATYLGAVAIGNAYIAALAASKIDTGILTGQTIRTSSSNPKIILNDASNNSLVFYDSGGTARGGIDGSGSGSGTIWGSGSPAYPTLKGINTNTGIYSAVQGEATGGNGGYFLSSQYEAVRGQAASYGVSSHGLVGISLRGVGTVGVVGYAGDYDFYANGAGTNYGPFTGAHDAVYANGVTVELGDIVVDVACLDRRGWSNTIFSVERSFMPMQPGAIGIVGAIRGALSESQPSAFISHRDENQNPVMSDAYESCKDAYQICNVNALGEGQIRVCGEGGSIMPGDLICCSSLPGKGMCQQDGTVRNYTVARAREGVEFVNDTEIKIIACIYLCG